MNLLEHLHRRGQIKMLVRLLTVAFPEFRPSDAECVETLPEKSLNELTDAIALRQP